MNDKEQKLVIPQRLWKDKRFTPIERMILSYRLGFKDFFASNEFVANEFGVTKKTVCETYRKAKEYGFIDYNKELPNGNSYQTVTAELPNRNCSNYETVTASYQTVTAELPNGNSKTQDLPMKTDSLYNRYSGSSPSGSLPSNINKIDYKINYKEQGTGQQEQLSEPDIITQFNKIFNS